MLLLSVCNEALLLEFERSSEGLRHLLEDEEYESASLLEVQVDTYFKSWNCLCLNILTLPSSPTRTFGTVEAVRVWHVPSVTMKLLDTFADFADTDLKVRVYATKTLSSSLG